MATRNRRRGGAVWLGLAWAWACWGAETAWGWRSELYPADWTPPQAREGLDFLRDEMVQDFSFAGYRRGEEPIPKVSGPVFDVGGYGADRTGEVDATGAIQAAIDAAVATGGGVVWLPAGRYRVEKPGNRNYALRIAGSGVVLRGAGWDRTFLVNTSTEMRGGRVIQVSPASGANWGTPRGGTVAVAKDYRGPTQEVELESLADFAVGDWVVLHNPFTDTVRSEGSMVQDVRMDGSVASTPSWVGLGENLDGPMMYRLITGVDAARKAVRLDAPTRWSLLRRDGARVYRVDGLLEEVGLEGFSIGNTRHPAAEVMGEEDHTDPARAAYALHASWLVALERVRNGWVREVRSFDPGNSNGAHMLSNGVLLKWCRGVTVEGVEMQRAQYGGGGGNGYMIRLSAANECLVRNSRVAHCRHGIVMWTMQNSGNVMYRNVDEFTAEQRGHAGERQTTLGKGSDHHGLLSQSNLFDRHVLRESTAEAAFRGNSGSSPPHGQTASQTVFWNTEGRAVYPGRNYIVHSQQAGRGYIIGTQGAAVGANSGPKVSGSTGFTDPVDRIEGVGAGATLEPASLYEDQVARRRAREGHRPEVPGERPEPEVAWDEGKGEVTVRVPSRFGRRYLLRKGDLWPPKQWAEMAAPIEGNGGLLEWKVGESGAFGALFFQVISPP